MEAIEQVTKTERENQERRAAAEAEARKLLADARRGGDELMRRVQEEAAEQAKSLLAQAEERGKTHGEEVSRLTETEASALRASAGKQMGKASAFIIERVVEH